MEKEKHKKKNEIIRLLEISGEKRGLLVVSGFFATLSTIMQFVPFLAIYMILRQLLIHASDLSGIDGGLLQSWGLWALVSLLVALVFLYIGMMSSHIAAFRILYGLRVKLSEHLAKLPMGYHTKKSTGTIKKILEISVEKIENFVAHQLPDFVSAVITIVLMLAAMYILDWRLALGATVPLIVAFVLQGMAFMGEEASERMKEYHDALEEMSATGVEYVRGMPAVKIFGLTVKSFLKFHSAIESYKAFAVGISNGYKHKYTAFLVIMASLASFILPVGIFILSGDPQNQAFALTFIMFLIVGPGISVPTLKLMYLAGNLRMIAEGVNRMDDIFAEEPLEEPSVPQVPQSFEVAFDKVGFSYQNADESTRTEALKDISLVAHAQQITALVGPSGSGKSTIANLIPRFWDVQKGSVTIGGIDIRKIGTEQLMDMVSFVFQDVHMFYDTIEENIRMGNAKASTEQVIKAAKAAQCHDFITALPSSYQTKIGEGGTYLSGGEAQRVSIARAILKDAPILVLDEATAFSDPENETNMQRAISSLIHNKTVIIIAHRLSTIRNADQIVVLDKGVMRENGTHEQLLAENALYARMWHAHMDADAWNIPKDRYKEKEANA